MESLRNRALAAAVDILGSQGLRALTHRRVDERAGLPAGSTSNYFRSRRRRVSSAPAPSPGTFSLEAARHGHARAPLVQNRHLFEERTIAMLAGLGAPDPDAAALALMACGESLMLHRLTVDDSIEFRPVVALVVRACPRPRCCQEQASGGKP